MSPLHDFSKISESTVLNNADGRHAFADHRGDLPVIEFLNEAEHDHLALFVPKIQDRPPDVCFVR